MDIHYRKLKSGDAQAFWNLMNRLDYETQYMMYEPGERKERGMSPSSLGNKIENAEDGTDFLLAATCGGELIGYIWAERGSCRRVRHTAYIVTGIRKAYRNRGIGTTFFDRLHTWAGENGVRRLELTVMCTNAAALHLYKKSGFSVEGTRRDAMRIGEAYIDEYYMAKILSEEETRWENKMK